MFNPIRLDRVMRWGILSAVLTLLSGCVIEEGLPEDDPMGGGLAGAEIIIAGDEAGDTAGDGAGTISAGDTPGFMIDMWPPEEECDVELPTCDPDTYFDRRSCECVPVNSACACDDVYDPVCGEDERTYSNECQLNCAGQRLAYYGDCESPYVYECFEPNPDVDYVSEDPYECEFIDFDCPSGAEYYYDECGCGCYERDCNAECVGAERESVCTPQGERYPSECHAICEGAYAYRACESSCDCPAVYAPQCGLDGNTYDNSCLRECLDVPLNYDGECNADEWLCEDERAWESCEFACREIAGCFTNECSMDEMARLNASCTGLCEDYGPELICSFGTCWDAPILFTEFQAFIEPVECLEENLCPDEFEGAEYVSYSPDDCRLIGEIDCGDQESFNNRCGCGCIGNACLPETEARYVSRDSETCERISIDCPEGSQVFTDACGCGCRF